MADYEFYNPKQAYEEAVARKEQAMQRLMDMAAQRQQAVDQAAIEEQRVLGEQQQADQQAQSEDKLNWFDDASAGASTGASIGGVAGPIGAAWGALAGGTIGTIKGQVESYKERKRLNPGKSGLRNFASTVGDTPFGFNLAGGGSHQKLDGNSVGVAATLGNAVYSKYRNQPASDADLATAAQKDAESKQMYEDALAGTSRNFQSMQDADSLRGLYGLNEPGDLELKKRKLALSGDRTLASSYK